MLPSTVADIFVAMNPPDTAGSMVIKKHNKPDWPEE
jgi:hypothetical protein